MPRAVPLTIRQALWRGHQRGCSAPELAHQFRLPVRTVYHLLRQASLHHGNIGPAAYHSPPPGPRSSPSLVDQVLAFRQTHPEWGTEVVRIFLAEENPGQLLPSSRTIRRWLEQAGLATPTPGRRSSSQLYTRATAVHESWQMDAADQMPLATGMLVSWLRIVDECSGAVLRTVVFPLGVQPGLGGLCSRGAA